MIQFRQLISHVWQILWKSRNLILAQFRQFPIERAHCVHGIRCLVTIEIFVGTCIIALYAPVIILPAQGGGRRADTGEFDILKMYNV